MRDPGCSSRAHQSSMGAECAVRVARSAPTGAAWARIVRPGLLVPRPPALLDQNALVPLVDVTYDDSVSEAELRRLAELLPDVVAEAVDCPEEPWVGPAGVGDIEIRFRRKSEHDVGQLRVVIEVRTRRLEGRIADQQRRAELIRDRLAPGVAGPIGVWLMLIDGAWSQS
jgi:hypothetical protein